MKFVYKKMDPYSLVNIHKNIANIRQDAYKRYWSNGVNDSEMPCILIIQGYMRWNNELNFICIRSFIVWL